MSLNRAIPSLLSLPTLLVLTSLAAVPLLAEPIRLVVEEADHAVDRPLVNPAQYQQPIDEAAPGNRISILLEEEEAPQATWRPTGKAVGDSAAQSPATQTITPDAKPAETAPAPNAPSPAAQDSEPPLAIFRVKEGNLVQPVAPAANNSPATPLASDQPAESVEEPAKIAPESNEADRIPAKYSFRPAGSSEPLPEAEASSTPDRRRATIRLAPVISARNAAAASGTAKPKAPKFQVTDQGEDSGMRQPWEKAPARNDAAQPKTTPAQVVDSPEPMPTPVVPEPTSQPAPMTVQAEVMPPAARENFVITAIKPDETTVTDIHAQLGEPDKMDEQDGYTIHTYESPPGYARMELGVEEGRVHSIFVALNKSRVATELEAELGLTGADPAQVYDDMGGVIGTVYPEQGMLLVRVEGTAEETSIESVIMQSPAAEAFYLRALDRPADQVEAQIADLQEALRRDPGYGESWWRQAKLLNRIGAIDEALEAVEKAVASPEARPEFRLTRAVFLAHRGKYSASLEEVRKIAEDQSVETHVRAQAYCHLGDLLQSGGGAKNREALEHHMKAIQLAGELVNSPEMLPRRAAKQVLVDAHLGLAIDIAAGDWQQKDETVPKWLARAETYIDDLIQNEQGSTQLKFQRLRKGLVANSHFDSAWDATQASAEIKTFGTDLVERSDDRTFQRIVEWEIGQSLIQAFFIEHGRQNYEEAIVLAEDAHRYQAAGGVDRDLSMAETLMLGNLYFRTGTIFAVDQQDHELAVSWYERAEPLLTSAEVAGLMHDRRGESLVSIGVSYWEVGKQEAGIRLTEQGLELIQLSVEQRKADPSKLQVPLSNLAKMHRSLGNEVKSEEYTAARQKITPNAPAGKNPLR
ncbi:MAG: hypothetical protein WD045_15970 [Pirellulaceae bacterium]